MRQIPWPFAGLTLAKTTRPQQWLALFAMSAIVILLMILVGLPGVWLLGPMLAGVAIGVGGGSIRVAPALARGSQAILGCMVASLITHSVLVSFVRQWPTFLGATLSTLVASSLLGWWLSRQGLLPGTTAIWGMSPGAASVMAVLAEEHGGDARLAAFMQYLRVICVATLASVIARFWIGGSGGVGPPQVYFPPLRLVPFAETLAIAGGGILLAGWFKIRSGAVMVPLAIGSILHSTGAVEIELPRWLLVATFAVLGWSIGLQFTRKSLAHAARSFPMILASVAALIAFCGGVAVTLHYVAGTELLTAYLATSPGGLDAAAVIAASTKVDMPFVMGLQTVRLLVVLTFGPALARFVALRSGPGAAAPESTEVLAVGNGG